MEVKGMTITDKVREYEDIVNRPGKFEQEPRYVPYYWDIYLNGFADDDDGEVLTFNVESEDVAMFPELKGKKTVKIVELDNGFVIEL
jgi:hypothetical protein